MDIFTSRKLELEGHVRIPSGCAISGIFNRKGVRTSGEDIIKSIALMHDRSNGLGGGFAAYGIYPEYANFYAFHLFYEDTSCQVSTEKYIETYFDVEHAEIIPTNKTEGISDAPIIWRYFLKPNKVKMRKSGLTEKEYVMRNVMKINGEFPGAFVASSGKNMGAFKGVGYPEDIGRFYRLEEYNAYLWTAHGRFPTNTPGWWGGAHPFTLLDWSVVHNGEISSYGANRRYLEMFDYVCALQTDTEAITYAFDYLLRKQQVPLDVAVTAIAPPFWKDLAQMTPKEQEKVKTIRAMYSSLLINGPFSVILGSANGMMALNDRIKLRPLVAGERGDFLYVASEEAAIREICPELDRIWSPRGGEPVIGLLEGAEKL